MKEPVFIGGELGTTHSYTPSAPCTGIIAPGCPVILRGNSGEVGTVVKVWRNTDPNRGGTGDEDCYVAFEGYPDKNREILPPTYTDYVDGSTVEKDLRDLEGDENLQGVPLMSETVKPYVLRYGAGSLLLRLDLLTGRQRAMIWLGQAVGMPASLLVYGGTFTPGPWGWTLASEQVSCLFTAVGKPVLSPHRRIVPVPALEDVNLENPLCYQHALKLCCEAMAPTGGMGQGFF